MQEQDILLSVSHITMAHCVLSHYAGFKDSQPCHAMPCLHLVFSFVFVFFSVIAVTCPCGIPRSWILHTLYSISLYAARTTPDAFPAHDPPVLCPCPCLPAALIRLYFYAEGLLHDCIVAFSILRTRTAVPFFTKLDGSCSPTVGVVRFYSILISAALLLTALQKGFFPMFASLMLLTHGTRFLTWTWTLIVGFKRQNIKAYLSHSVPRICSSSRSYSFHQLLYSRAYYIISWYYITAGSLPVHDRV